MDDLFSNTLERLLEDHCQPAQLREIEASGVAEGLWKVLEDSGFPDAMVDEAAGGANLHFPELFGLFELCGRYAVPVPLAETIVARAILNNAGVDRPCGSIAFALASPTSEGGVRCDTTNLGQLADWILTRGSNGASLLPVRTAERLGGARSLRTQLTWSRADVDNAIAVRDEFDILSVQACIYAAQLAGALMSVFHRTLQYANERVQFGRPIGKFQAIQHQLAIISEHVFAARMAAQLGAVGAGTVPARSRVAVAKARTSEAALQVASLAHSIHGAIGFTQEFDLQLFTRRLHAWRQAGGSESYWYDVLGAELVDKHAGFSLDMVREITDPYESEVLQ